MDQSHHCPFLLTSSRPVSLPTESRESGLPRDLRENTAESLRRIFVFDITTVRKPDDIFVRLVSVLSQLYIKAHVLSKSLVCAVAGTLWETRVTPRCGRSQAGCAYTSKLTSSFDCCF